MTRRSAEAVMLQRCKDSGRLLLVLLAGVVLAYSVLLSPLASVAEDSGAVPGKSDRELSSYLRKIEKRFR